MNIKIQGVEITLTPEQLKQIDAEIKKMEHPIQRSKEDRFFDLISDLRLKVDFTKYPNCIFLFKGDECWVEYDIKNGYLWLKHSTIWSVFEKEYSLNYSEVQSFIKILVEEHFKLKGVTPRDF